MKKLTFLFFLFCTLTIFSDPMDKERKMIKEDRLFVTQLEKELSIDEKGCDNPSKDLDFSVFMELKIYCNSRASIRNHLPEIKSLIVNYENYLNNYWENCKVAVTGPKIELCKSMNSKLQKRALKINAEKEQLQNNLLTMKTAGEQAKKLYERKTREQEKKEEQNIREALKIKKETVKLMRSTIKDDSLIFKRSLAQINKMHHQNNPKLKNAIASMQKILKFLLKSNSELIELSHSLSRKIDNTNSQCTIKHFEKGCRKAEKKMIASFKTANSKFETYSGNKNEAVKLELQLHKIAINTVDQRMRQALEKISSYISSLEAENTQLKTRVKTSETDMETVKNTGNKQFIAIYKAIVNKMISLERQSAEYITTFKSDSNQINSYIADCTENSLNFSSDCGKKGNKLIVKVEKTVKKVIAYAKEFNRLNRDLADFAKKVSGE